MLKHWVARLLPARHEVAMRYWYRCIRGHIEPEMDVFVSLARPSATVIDVGANSGIYSYALWRRGCTVHAFEPIPQCIPPLRALPITTHQVALSDQTDEMTLYIPYMNGYPHCPEASFRKPAGLHVGITVPVTTLDVFGFRNVSAIKIDVEGHEMGVLRGALETIQRERPVLLVEIEARHGADVGATVEFIRALGYDMRPQMSTHNFLFLPTRAGAVHT